LTSESGAGGSKAEKGAGAVVKEIGFQSEHGARHLAGTGLNATEVENAIRQSIEASIRGASATGSFWGRVTVRGKVIEYRAFTPEPGRINVGTYYPVGN